MKPFIEYSPKKGQTLYVIGKPTIETNMGHAEAELKRRKALKAAQMRRYRARKKAK